MKIKRLKMVNVGPYRGEVEIDFDKFPALFLIEGETGSGKTVILDSIIYALYGQIPSISKMGVGQKIRSDHASVADETYVELVFSVPTGTYLIKRGPSYERAKAKGEGTTEQNAFVSLFELVGGDYQNPKLIEDKSREVGFYLDSILPLTFDQFTQTVILPQGSFSQFLKATSVERQPLLQTIFGTKFYQDVQDYLREQATLAKTSTNSQRTVTEQAIKVLIGDAKDSSCKEQAETLLTLFEDQDFPKICQLIAQLEDEFQLDHDAVFQKKEQARINFEAKEKALRLLEELSQKIVRREKYQQQLAQLEESKEAHQRIKEQLDMTAKAQLVQQSHLLCVKRQEEESSARRDVLEKLTQIDLDIPSGQIPDVQGVKELTKLARQWELKIDTLKSQAQAEEDFEARQEEFTQRCQESQVLEETVSTSRKHLAELKQDIEQQKRLLKESEENFNLEKFNDAKDQVSAAEKQVEAHQEIIEKGVQLRHLKQQLDTATQGMEDVQKAEDAARNLWHLDLAGQLAADLVPGKACPVCGGVEHPHPATHTEGKEVSGETVSMLSQKTSQANAEYASAKATYDAAAWQLEKLKTQTTGTQAQAQSALKKAKDHLSELETVSQKITDLNSQIDSCQQEYEEGRETLTQQSTELTALKTALKKDQQQLEKTKQELTKYKEGFASVAQALSRKQQQNQDLRNAIDALHQFHTAQQELERAQKDRQTQVRKNGFDSLSKALAGLIEGDDLAQLTKKWEDWSSAYEGVKQALAGEEFGDLAADATVPDPSQATQEKDQASKELEAQITLLGRSEAQLDSFRKHATNALDKLTAYQEATQSSRDILWLSDIANNESKANRLETPLKNYVLSARFEQVIASANSRLQDIQNGRYQLERTESDVTRKNRSHGLDVGIRDFSTGQLRSVYTLSGGETFFVSMALALGLADVVTGQAGGIKLETMFIDEGFGTLSNDHLEDVLEVLRSLPASGRNVGVISHVETLRQEIPDQINVHQNSDKTSTLSCKYG